jgi:hypothetical protein
MTAIKPKGPPSLDRTTPSSSTVRRLHHRCAVTDSSSTLSIGIVLRAVSTAIFDHAAEADGSYILLLSVLLAIIADRSPLVLPRVTFFRPQRTPDVPSFAHAEACYYHRLRCDTRSDNNHRH